MATLDAVHSTRSMCMRPPTLMAPHLGARGAYASAIAPGYAAQQPARLPSARRLRCSSAPSARRPMARTRLRLVLVRSFCVRAVRCYTTLHLRNLLHYTGCHSLYCCNLTAVLSSHAYILTPVYFFIPEVSSHPDISFPLFRLIEIGSCP